MKRFFILCAVFMMTFQVLSQVGAPRDRRRTPRELQQLANMYAIGFAAKKIQAEQAALQKGWPIKKEYPDGRIIEIMELGPNGMPEYNTTTNLDAARTSGTDELWPGGTSGLNLTGSGFTIGEWDGGGVRVSHQEFRVGSGSSRVIQKDGASPTSYHSTHVAGTLIAEGDVGSAHGMANAAGLHAYDWDNDVSEMLNANAVDGIILSNHSYGRVRGWNQGSWDYYWMGDTTISRTEDYQFGFYGPLTKTWDSMAYVMQDFLFVKSAGNDRGDSHSGSHLVWDPSLQDWVHSSWPRDVDGGSDGYDCIENRACAKNLLTVGAVDDIPGGYTVPADVVMSIFSCWGPTDDGRIKPDIVANGIDLYSTDDDSDNDYTSLSGTSMSSPAACGTLALLQDYHHDLMGTYLYADELKALVINTAYEAGPNPGPDYMFGWGLLNAQGAADLVTLEDSEGHHIDYHTLLHASEVDEYLYYADGSDDINVTIAWVDPPHAAMTPALNPTTSHLVHDLDVRVVRVSTSTTYYPWKLNPATPSNAAYTGDNTRDNIEKITLLSPVAGQYKILVSLSGSLIEDQFYALVVSGMEHEGVPGLWTGAVSNNWNTAGNWDDGVVPDVTISVTIPSGCPRYPLLTGNLGVSYSSGATYLCDNLTVEQGGILTIDGADLLCAGNANLAGTLYAGDDVTFYNGGVLTHSGTLYTGYTDSWYGVLTVNSGATVNHTAGTIYTEEITLASGCQFNGSGGYCRIYAHTSVPATQNIQIDDAESYFNNFYIETGTNAQLNDCAADLDVFNIDVNGTLTLGTYTITADYADVYGTLTLNSGLFDVLQNGPYFHNGSVFNMSGGTLNGNESIRFYTGATENVTGGDIGLLMDFYDEDEIFSPTGGNFHFTGGGASNINGPTSFYNLYINKTYTGFDAVENGTGDGAGVDITVAEMLYIQDGSFELNSPCILSVGSYVLIDENAALNANDSPDVLIRLQGSWSNQNLTGGFNAGLYSVLELNSPPGSPGIQILGDNNLFNDIAINSGAPYVRPSLNPGYGLIHARNIDINEGALNCAGKKIIVDQTLNIYDQLTLIDPLDSLIVGDIYWRAASVDAVSNGKILVNGSWTWENGTNASITSGNLVKFTGSSTEYIYSYDSNADFYNLDIDKGSYTVYIASASTQPVDVLHNMNVFSGSLFHVNTETLNVNGTLDVKNGAQMILFNGSTVDLDGDFTQNGFIHLNTGGNFYVHGAFQEASTGHLNIQSGSFICDKPYYSAKALQYLHGTLTMGGGLFEVTHNHIQMSATFIDNITGGTMRTGGSFIAVSNVFQPAGGTVELSNSTVPGTPYVDLNTGNWMINLVVNGNTTWLLGGSGATTLTVKQDLTINSGALEGGAGDVINLGDDWINNAGTSGFIPGTSIVYLTAQNPAPDRQMISGTTTFYNLANQNNTTLIEFAGPVTVSNNYSASAGGTEGETFITGSPCNINNLILPSGAFSLSTSAPVVNVSSMVQGGAISVTNGILDIGDLIETELLGSYTIYNGLIDITQDGSSFMDINADIHIAGGELRLSGGTDVSYWPITGTHVFTMSGGILDFKNLGIYLASNNMTYNISGGVIRTVGDFYALATVSAFDPVFNEIELYGTGNSNVNVGTGSWFHDLTINKTGAQVNATRSFPVKGELDVRSGTFNTNNYLITVGP